MKKIKLLKIIENGGATLDRNGEAVDFSRGYQVSRRDCYTLNIENIGEILAAVNGLLSEIGAGEFVGLWVNDGQLFIDIQGKTVKYCFTRHTNHKRTLNGNQYMSWDSCRNWTIPTDYMTQEDIDLCKGNIRYITEHAELMTVDELKEFVTADYSITPLSACTICGNLIKYKELLK